MNKCILLTCLEGKEILVRIDDILHAKISNSKKNNITFVERLNGGAFFVKETPKEIYDLMQLLYSSVSQKENK